MSSKALWLVAATPFLIRYICECMARGLPEHRTIDSLINDFPLDRQEAKALFGASLRHLKIEGLDREQERGLALARLTFLYRSLVEKHDFKGAHAVEQTRIALLRLHEVNVPYRILEPAEREKGIALQKATEQKGEELFEVLQNLKNEALALKKKADELAAEAAGRDRASGGQADGSARRGAEKGQEGAKADGKSV